MKGVRGMALLMCVLFLAFFLSVGNRVRAQESGGENYVPSDTENMTVLTTANLKSAARVSLEVGDVVGYGGYSTNYFSVDGKTAYCLEPLKSTPPAGEYTPEPLENGRLRKGLYYVYGGPGYNTFVTKYGYLGYAAEFRLDSEYCMSHCIVAYLYSGDQDAFVGLGDDLVSALKTEIDWIMSLPDPPASFYAFTFRSGSDSQAIGGSGKDRTGTIEVYKKSNREEWTKDNSCYSLKGAVFGIYEQGSDTLVCTVTTDEKGYGRAAELPIGDYEIAELKNPKGFALDGTKSRITVEENIVSRYDCTEKAQNYPAKLLIKKTDADTGKSQPQGEASLEGAEFTVKYYADHFSSDPEKAGGVPRKTWVFRSDREGRVLFTEDMKTGGDALYTDSDGNNTLPLGTLVIQETKAPTGYLADPDIHILPIESAGPGETDTVYHSPVIEEQVIRGGVLVEKWDSETEQNKPQGKAMLSGTKIQIISLNDSPVTVDGVVQNKGDVITTLVTDENGTAQTGESYLPYGSYRLKEAEPPEGYNCTGVLSRDFEIREDGVKVEMNTSSKAIKNDIIRGGVALVKFREDTDEEQDQKTSLEGIVFSITSKTTKEQYEIVTDERGYASTEQLGNSGRGGLVYDTYVVSEKNTPKGLKPVEDFEVTISEEGRVLHYILENKQIMSPVKLVKTDADTGRVIPLADSEFRLLDENREPIAMTMHYPKETVMETFCTDENGSFILPEKLPAGTYYFEEIRAPEGYVLADEPVRFEIEEGHNWDEPFEAEFSNQPAKGRIHIKKTDDATGKPLAGTVFEIRAKEDIITPDGTVRVEKGETAGSVTTGEDGSAVSEELFLGIYEVEEVRQTPGYVRADEKYEVSLQYEGQDTAVVTVVSEVRNSPTRIVIEKREAGTIKGLSGVEFAIWMKEKDDPGDPSGDEAEKAESVPPGLYSEVIATNGEGRIVLEGLLPGTYCIQEREGLDGYRMDDTVREITIDEAGRIEGKGSVILTVENDRTHIADTTAVWKGSGAKLIKSGGKERVVDTVELTGLQMGEEYRLSGVLMDKTEKEELLQNGKAVMTEKTFTAETAEMEVEMEFDVDTAGLEGRQLVVYETLCLGEQTIDSHKDLEDEGQTVEVQSEQRASVKTGDRTAWVPAFALAAAISAGVWGMAVVMHRRKNRKQSD